jgi:hypothetical protein
MTVFTKFCLQKRGLPRWKKVQSSFRATRDRPSSKVGSLGMGLDDREGSVAGPGADTGAVARGFCRSCPCPHQNGHGQCDGHSKTRPQHRTRSAGQFTKDSPLHATEERGEMHSGQMCLSSVFRERVGAYEMRRLTQLGSFTPQWWRAHSLRVPVSA